MHEAISTNHLVASGEIVSSDTSPITSRLSLSQKLARERSGDLDVKGTNKRSSTYRRQGEGQSHKRKVRGSGGAVHSAIAVRGTTTTAAHDGSRRPPAKMIKGDGCSPTTDYARRKDLFIAFAQV
jgi:hypothetical protein